MLHLQRRPFPHHYSIERYFEIMRASLPASVEVTVHVSSHPSRGLVPRVRALVEARRVARSSDAEVLHVTGDTTFLALALDRHRTLVTVHDCEFLHRAGVAKRLLYRWFWLRLPARRAAVVNAVSERSADDLAAAASIDRRRIAVIGAPLPPDLGASPPPPPREVPIVLQVGTRHNKNVERLAKALAGLRCRLRLIGPLDPRQRALLDDLGVAHEELTALSDAEVADEYRSADVIAFVSTFEGFGMPVIEAQAVGRPIVTSDRAPMAEVAGSGACLVDPTNVASIRSGFERVLGDTGYRARLVAAGLENCERFRAERIAGSYARLYDQIATGNHARGDTT